MNRRAVLTLPAILLQLVLATSSLATAQESNFTPQLQAAPSSGWTLTPSLVYSTAYDSNALMRGVDDRPASDVVNMVNPRGDVAFNGRRGQFEATYDGAFLFYRELSTLNSYDQHGSMAARRLLSKRITLFARDTIAMVPTTELVQLVAVPFVRSGSRINDAQAGVEAALTKYTSVTAAYHFQWVQFDDNPAFASVLFGGHSHGGSIAVKHALSPTTALIADYDLTHAVIAVGAETFDIQNGTVGLEQRLSDVLRVFGAAGVSHLAVTSFGPARSGPSYRAGLTRQLKTAAFDVEYSRAFVPSYGFGGTAENEEATLRLRAPLTRRLYTHTSLAWRRNEPLAVGDLRLRSWWVEANVGYSLRPWVHIEGFYGGTHQSITRPGGLAERHRIGFQIVTSRPMRID